MAIPSEWRLRMMLLLLQ